MFTPVKRATVFAAPAAALVLTALATGCAKTSPAVGTWTGTTPLKSSATLTLAAGGTGTVSIPPLMQNKPVTWKEGENKTIEISMGGGAPASSGGAASAPGAGGPTIPATLSEDGKSMTLSFPMASIQLTKSEGGK